VFEGAFAAVVVDVEVDVGAAEVVVVDVVFGADDPPQAERRSAVTVSVNGMRSTQKWLFMT
jgi:hypothetical protein